MSRFVILPALIVILAAGPAAADTRLLSYDAADRVTQALTRGVTLEVERGLFGRVTIKRLFSTTSRGSAEFQPGGPDLVLQALPEGSPETDVYTIAPDGDGRPLARALCPGADEVWLAVGRVRAVRPLTLQAVGRWSDGRVRQCVALSYDYRGEWVRPPAAGPGAVETGPPVTPR